MPSASGGASVSYGTGKCIVAVLASKVLAAAPVVRYPVQFAAKLKTEGEDVSSSSTISCRQEPPLLKSSRAERIATGQQSDSLDWILVWFFGVDWDCQWDLGDGDLCQCRYQYPVQRMPVLKQSVSG